MPRAHMTMAALVQAAEEQGVSLGELALQSQAEYSGKPPETVLLEMIARLNIMRGAIAEGLEGKERSLSGMVGGDAAKVAARAGTAVTGSRVQLAVARAMATSEVNACMGCIVAAPTAGAAGVLPAVIVTAGEAAASSDEAMARALLAAGLVGAVIARVASVSGPKAAARPKSAPPPPWPPWPPWNWPAGRPGRAPTPLPLCSRVPWVWSATP